MRKPLLFLALLGAALSAFAQQSASFKVEEHAFNAGGNPVGGSIGVSASFRMTLDSVGGPVGVASMGSGSFRMEGGFAGSFPPPGEVKGLRFHAGLLAEWNPERSTGAYALYSGPLPGLALDDYGTCSQEVLTTSTVVATGGSVAEFYLVTATNRLGEEGMSGFTSSSAQRPDGTPCP